ncbi:MAG: DUF1731 domain-containing protein [Armatimonadota bacterium]
MKVLIPGGSGHVGQILVPFLTKSGHEVRVLSRKGDLAWNPRYPDSLVHHLDWADAIINLAGRSVNCRYNAKNLAEMMESRVQSVEAVSEALTDCAYPPTVWLQASTATIYSHRLDAPNDEQTGRIDPIVGPPKWQASERIALAWEAALFADSHPRIRKVALRSAMTMSATPGSVFDVMAKLARCGLLGTYSDGKQYVSWIHELDFCRAVELLLGDTSLDGPVNLCSPHPLPNREFNRILREAVGSHFGLHSPKWALEIGAAMMKTETELILKSRRVIPKRLLDHGFRFDYSDWQPAAQDLAKRLKAEG